ncbi:MAG: 1-deoxy-D-xylulose 5-phosphate reductoisomerase [Alphaproteobacteria bacterium ADurb.Bin438]|nr:MAG: 1-deoxy-D-xylulose 5-phosphate reductoisomerase [Alphaproteobacteria bacterium ADurb.Bin438]
MKSISIIGSTGSVGKNTVEVVNFDKSEFEVIALTAGKNVNELVNQANLLNPKIVAIQDESKYNELKEALNNKNIEILCGDEGVVEAASVKSDISLLSIVGEAGLKPALASVKNGGIIALANKETLVCAGDLFLNEVKKYNATLIPVDSEHSAIFQSLDPKLHDKIDKIILTASGGPFRETSLQDLEKVTIKDALKHPNWSMGAKISIDSATMMNKALEVIEAYHLFRVPFEKIEVVIHPQSILHSGVSYVDGALIAELGVPDMKCPIAYALHYPLRNKAPVKPLDLTSLSALTFYKPDKEKFKSLALVEEVLKIGKSAPCVMNAANEIAVDAFLKEKISFLSIFDIVKKTLESVPLYDIKCLDDVFNSDFEARKKALEFI